MTQAPTCMEITCKNYKQRYNDIENVVKNASFAAVDVEFLGLDPEDAPSRCSLFDTPELRFEKQRNSVKRFPPVQLGVAFFTEVDQGQKYKIDVYNVYLFKHEFQHHEYSFSVSSLAFLETHGFDFNKLINDGVCHMNLDELKDVIEQVSTKNSLADSFGEDFQTLFNQALNTLNKKLARLRRKSTGSEGAAQRSWDGFHLLLGGSELSEVQRSVLLYRLYSSVPGVRMRIAGNILEVDPTRLKKKDLVEKKAELLRKITKELVGASDVLMAMIEARLPLVGHNSLYDIMYMYQYFVANLPVSYEEFKVAINAVFPCVFDTKILAEESKHQLSWHGVMSFRLESLGAYFDSKLSESSVPSPTFEFPPEFRFMIRRQRKVEAGGGSYHNAAFDALTTGQAFIKLAHLVAQPIQPESLRGQCLPFKNLLYAVRPFANRVPVPLLGVPYINLMGEDPPSRNPEEIILEIVDSDDLESLRKELRSQFGRWRCEANIDGNVVRLATNTTTTYRRVYNFFSMHPSYRMLSSPDYSDSSCCSFSSDSTPRRMRSPSCSSSLGSSIECLELDNILGSSSCSSTSTSSSLSQSDSSLSDPNPIYQWFVVGLPRRALCATSLLATAQILSRPFSPLF